MAPGVTMCNDMLVALLLVKVLLRYVIDVQSSNVPSYRRMTGYCTVLNHHVVLPCDFQ